MTPDDSALVARVVACDDRAAFGELIQRHQSAVRRFLRALTRGDHALADDLAQETFIQAYHALPRYGQRASFSTWLLGIAHNYWRNDRRRRRAVALEPEHIAAEAVPSGARQSDLQHDLALALAQLSADERSALHLSYEHGLSHGEIADILGWPLGSVKTSLARSKEKLRPLLAPWNTRT